MTASSAVTDKLVEKIRKLLALANDAGANENEAALALERAHALLAEHHLSMELVNGPAASSEDVSRHDLWERGELFEDIIFMAAGELNFCKPMIHRYRDERDRLVSVYAYIGTALNAAVARSMNEYLVKTLRRLCTAEIRRTLQGRRPQEKWHFKRAYRTTAASTISVRVNALVKARERGDVVATGTNLPALLSLYERARSANEEFGKTQGLTKGAKRGLKTWHEAGAGLGKLAGEQVSLDPQVAGTKPRERLT